MIVTKAAMKSEVVTALRGGPGSLNMTDLTGGVGPCRNSRLISECLIPPGAGIGEHAHVNETEYYIILEGEATVADNGKNVTVKAGDVVITGDGAKHSITNTGKNPMKMIAVIITYNS